MGAAWARHAMCDSAFTVRLWHYLHRLQSKNLSCFRSFNRNPICLYFSWDSFFLMSKKSLKTVCRAVILISCQFVWFLYASSTIYCRTHPCPRRLKLLVCICSVTDWNVQWFRWLDCGFLRRKPAFHPMRVHVGFVMDIVAFNLIFLRIFGFHLSAAILQVLCVHINSSIIEALLMASRNEQWKYYSIFLQAVATNGQFYTHYYYYYYYYYHRISHFIHLSWDMVINRIRLGGLIYSLENFLQLNMCREIQIFLIVYICIIIIIIVYYYYYYHHHHHHHYLLYTRYLYIYSWDKPCP